MERNTRNKIGNKYGNKTKREGFNRYGSSFTIGAVGRCNLSTLGVLIDYLDKLEEFQVINLKTTGEKLWIVER